MDQPSKSRAPTKRRARWHINVEVKDDWGSRFRAFCETENRSYASAATYLIALGLRAFYDHGMTGTFDRPPSPRKSPTE